MLLDLSYGIPIAVNCARGRKMLPERKFMLPNILGWILNIVRVEMMMIMAMTAIEFYRQNPKANPLVSYTDFLIIHQLDDGPFSLPTRTACYGIKYELVKHHTLSTMSWELLLILYIFSWQTTVLWLLVLSWLSLPFSGLLTGERTTLALALRFLIPLVNNLHKYIRHNK